MFSFLCWHSDIALVVVYEIALYLRLGKVDLQLTITAHMVFKNLAFFTFYDHVQSKIFTVHGELL